MKILPIPAVVGICIIFGIISPVNGADKPADQDSPELTRALELYDQFKMVEAMPLLQKLVDENPQNGVLWERLGMAILNYASTIDDPEQSRLTRVKARETLLKAKALGDNSNLLQTVLSLTPEDGGNVKFSAREEVDKAMKQAEADYSRGDFDKALQGYALAISLDPKLYEAALFTGDVYFKQHKPELAREWFDRAIKINPDCETAYRYWGDTLMQNNKMTEARSKFIEAVIAEPYSNRSWIGLSQWAEANGVKLRHENLHDLSSVDKNNIKLNMDLDQKDKKKQRVVAAWLAYGLKRATWQTKEFKKQYPKETEYRFTSTEEESALHMLVTILQEEKPKIAVSDLEPALAELVRVDKAGLLVPYVFLHRATDSIAKDYPAYRAAHSDEVRRYLDEFLVPCLK